MSRIRKWYIWIAVVILVSGAPAIILFSIRPDKQKGEGEEPMQVNSARAVPSDAIFLACFKEADDAMILSDSSSVFLPVTGRENPLFRVLQTLSGSHGDLVISLHTSAKNELSALISYKLPDDKEKADSLRKGILSEINGSKYKDYNNITISNLPGLFYSLTPEFFIASPSLMVLESSVRHLVSGSSVLDNPDLKKVIKGLPGADNGVIINHNQLGKFISATGSPALRKQITFISRFAGWTVLSGNFSKNLSVLKGSAFISKDQGNYISSLRGIEGKNSSVAEMLPFSTLVAVSFTPLDFSGLAKNYRDYREFYNRQDLKEWSETKEWFLAMKPQELAAALILYNNQLHWITLLKCGNSKSYNPVIIPGEDFRKGACSKLFGSIFSYTREEDHFFSEGWLITGSKEVINGYRDGKVTELTLKSYFASTQAESSFGTGNAPVTFYASLSTLPDSVASMFRSSYRPIIKARLKGRNFEAVTGSLSFSSTGGFVINVISDMSKRPAPKSENSISGSDAAKVQIEIPKGPFSLVNPQTNEKEYLEQLPNFMLRLTDRDHKGIWTIPFETPLRGYVEQVDFFKNNQKQMLFASGNRLYLLDRKGKYVSPYPKKIDSLILLGPKCYDPASDGDFAIMVLGTDNTLRLYDRMCKPYPAWSNIRTPGTIREFPGMMKIGKNNYFILRTDIQTHIYTVNGIEVAKLPAGERIAPDSEINAISDDEIIVKSDKKRYFSINVESGKIKLKK